MDTIILIMGIAFLGILAVGFLLFYKETPAAAPGKTREQEGLEKNQEARLSIQLQKKIALYEEKIKTFQTDGEKLRTDLTLAQEKERSLLKEKSAASFDAGQYEKFKKEYHDLKEELIKKEGELEKEIASRRQQASEFTTLRQENDSIKKRVAEAEDAQRKSQIKIETLQKDLNLAKKTIEDQKKIVHEHSTNKKEGEWVSREEVVRLEQQLMEKDALLKQFLKK